MALSSTNKKQYRAIAHNLKPIIIVGDKGLSESLFEELNRALNDHELIKVKIAVGDRDERRKIISEMASKTKSELVQAIGRVVIFYKKNSKPNPKLSNLIRG